ncbi:hypothetical protein BDZ89DRAFT_1069139 [Hymenopellis radicata]|nr:hypothetical protein BDZ89DRAFT_1069139 [Hymenopellis radicata]
MGKVGKLFTALNCALDSPCSMSVGVTCTCQVVFLSLNSTLNLAVAHCLLEYEDIRSASGVMILDVLILLSSVSWKHGAK